MTFKFILDSTGWYDNSCVQRPWLSCWFVLCGPLNGHAVTINCMKFVSICPLYLVWLKCILHCNGNTQLYVCKSVLRFTRILVSKTKKIASQLKITVTEVCWSGDDKAIGLGRLGTLGHNPRRNIYDSRPDWGSARVQHKTRKLGGKRHVPYPELGVLVSWMSKDSIMFKTSIDIKIDIKMIWINRISTSWASYGMINYFWFWKLK